MTKNLHWTRLDTRVLCKTAIFDLCAQRMRGPDGVHEDDYYYLEIPSCVNILPVTDDRNVILISQYRHGINDLTLELPGGLINSDEGDAKLTAARELEEETGYSAKEFLDLGTFHSNPVLLTSTCHTFLASGVTRKSEQNLDHGEFINIEIHPLDSIPSLIAEGRITHSNMIATFFQFAIRYGKRFGIQNWLG